MKKISLVGLLFMAILLGCKKDKTEQDIVYSEENTFENLRTSIAQNSTINNVLNSAYYFEVGSSFKSLVKGNIKTLYVRIPDTSSILIVTIWDKSTQAKLLQTTVNITNSNTERVLDITPIAIEPNKEYIISMKTNDYYLYKKSGSTLISYPFTSGNIIYTATVSADPLTPGVMPTTAFNQGTYFGEVHFKFQQTQ